MDRDCNSKLLVHVREKRFSQHQSILQAISSLSSTMLCSRLPKGNSLEETTFVGPIDIAESHGTDVKAEIRVCNAEHHDVFNERSW